MKNLMLIVVILLVVYGAKAQTTEFTYQGRLTSTGTPATGLHDFEFSLYDALTGGTLAGTVARNNVAVANGIFTVVLDFGDQYPRFNHLEIKVKQAGGGTFTTLSPRQPIKAAPTAVASLKSATADNALLFRGEPPSSFVAEGDVRLTDARNPLAGSPNYIRNSTAQQDPASFNISGNGTAGTLSGNVVNSAIQFNLGGQRVLSFGDLGSASSNLFVGVGSGQLNLSGGANTFVGAFAGQNNATGRRNSFFGSGTGAFNTNGANNSFFGRGAGENSNSDNNSFFGHLTGYYNTSGTGNSFYGNGFFDEAVTGVTRATGFQNTTGNYNSFFGHRTGENNSTGSVNSFFGTGAGSTNTTGGSNSFFGHDTGNSNTTGSFNSALGKNADVATGDLKFATAIGAQALVSSNDTIVIGKVANFYDGVSRPADDVLIPGILSVGGPLYANGTMLTNLNASNITAGVLPVARGGTGSTTQNFVDLTTSQAIAGNKAFTGTLLAIDLQVSGNVGIGTFAPTNKLQIIDSSNTGLRVQTNASGGTVASFGGNGAFQVDASANPGGRFYITEDGKVGIGLNFDQSPDKLAVNGTVSFLAASGNGSQLCQNSQNQISICGSSNRRFKTNISEFSSGLSLINRLRPVSFDWKADGKSDMGLVAEEVAQVEPLLAFYDKDGQVQGVKYDRVGVILINAVKEQQAQIEAQQRQIEELKTIVCSLKPEFAKCQK